MEGRSLRRYGRKYELMRGRRDEGYEFVEGFLGWLSRFKLIRLRRISLATLPRYGQRGGRMGGFAVKPKVL